MGKHLGKQIEKVGKHFPLRDKKRDVRNYKQKKENDKNITSI
jgi:hypothetical protein